MAAVISAHAALKTADTATVAEELLRALANGQGDLDRALFAARMELKESDMQWAVPVYYARPHNGVTVSAAQPSELSQRQPQPGEEFWRGAPQRPRLFVGREALVQQGLELLHQGHRLISVLGMPGIGKTATVRELAERILITEDLRPEKVFWLSAERVEAQTIRNEIAIRLKRETYKREEFEQDIQLAHAINEARLLLVFDNVEHYLERSERRQLFLGLLQILLSECPRLTVLAGSRLALSSATAELKGKEQVLEMKPLTAEDARQLFFSVARLEPSEQTVQQEALEEIFHLLGGHPRALILVAGQLAQGSSAATVLEQLRQKGLKEVTDTNRIDSGKDSDEDAFARDARLTVSFNLAYNSLKRRDLPAAEVFVWLGTLPSGLPYQLAEQILEGSAVRLIAALRREHLADEADGDRLILPSPLNLYAAELQGELPEEKLHSRLRGTVSAYAKWFDTLCGGIDHPNISASLNQVLDDAANINELSKRLMQGIPRAEYAILFSSWARLMLYAGPTGQVLPVLERVLAHLRV